MGSPPATSDETQSGSQIKSRERVRDLAEVYTHEREVNAMLDLVPDMFPSATDPGNTDRTFLEPACGHGNFLVAILRPQARSTSRRAATAEASASSTGSCAASPRSTGSTSATENVARVARADAGIDQTRTSRSTEHRR